MKTQKTNTCKDCVNYKSIKCGSRGGSKGSCDYSIAPKYPYSKACKQHFKPEK